MTKALVRSVKDYNSSWPGFTSANGQQSRGCGQGRGGDANAVSGAELVGGAVGAIGIVAPWADHQKAVLVSAGRQRYGFLPQTIFVRFEAERRLLPAGKSAGDQNTGCVRRVVRERQ